MFIDTHAHLFYKDYHSQLDEVLERAAVAGVGSIICVGLDLATSGEAVALAEAHPNLWATVGIHPHEVKDAPADYLDRLKALAGHEKVVALGEMGLDYYRNLSPPELQRKVFQGQLELAQSLDLPAVVHNRGGADEDLMAIMEAVGHTRGVVHCFSSTPGFARQVIDFGFHISFTGTVTFGKNHNAAVLEAVGLDRVLVETDCPYLAPVPVRGKTNEPSYLPHTVSKIAEICSLPVQEVIDITSRNARAFFRLQNGEVQP